MIDFISRVFGEYTFEMFSLTLTFLETQFCVLLFSRKLAPKRLYVIRAVLGLLLLAPLCYPLAIWNTRSGSLFVRVLCYTIISSMNFLLLFICRKGAYEEILITFSFGMASYLIGNKLYPLIQNLAGINDRTTVSLFHNADTQALPWEWGLFFLFRIGTYLLLAFLFRSRTKLGHDKKTIRNVIYISIVTVLTINGLVCIARTYESESMILSIVVKLFSIMFALFILVTCTSIFESSEREQQITVLNQLMKQEKGQFESIKANMDTINMKCHDLKHIISRLEDKLTEDETASLKEAIEFYDSNIKTGNDVLDIVLCEKALICSKNNIAFSCMADGKLFSFLPPVQMYTLFGNIIDNAIEAVSGLEEPKKKVIALACRKDGDDLLVEEYNYFSGKLELDNGLPVTSKDDTSRHGYGTKSIKYIAEQYGGTMEISTEEDMFFLSVRFPA